LDHLRALQHTFKAKQAIDIGEGPDSGWGVEGEGGHGGAGDGHAVLVDDTSG
jgi:hypothetical protein